MIIIIIMIMIITIMIMIIMIEVKENSYIHINKFHLILSHFESKCFNFISGKNSTGRQPNANE